MTPDHIMITASQGLQDLVERYMNTQPQCLLCNDWPGMMPMVFVGDATSASGMRRCAAFAVCVVCRCQDNFEEHVSEALRQNQHQREGALWN